MAWLKRDLPPFVVLWHPDAEHRTLVVVEPCRRRHWPILDQLVDRTHATWHEVIRAELASTRTNDAASHDYLGSRYTP